VAVAVAGVVEVAAVAAVESGWVES